MLGSTEIIVLVVVIGVLIFGAKKIPELAKTFGKAKGEFEKGKIEGDKELKDFKGKLDESPKDKEVKSDWFFAQFSQFFNQFRIIFN